MVDENTSTIVSRPSLTEYVKQLKSIDNEEKQLKLSVVPSHEAHQTLPRNTYTHTLSPPVAPPLISSEISPSHGGASLSLRGAALKAALQHE